MHWKASSETTRKFFVTAGYFSSIDEKRVLFMSWLFYSEKQNKSAVMTSGLKGDGGRGVSALGVGPGTCGLVVDCDKAYFSYAAAR